MDHDPVEPLDPTEVSAGRSATFRSWDVQEPDASGTTVSEDGTCVVVHLLGEHDAANSDALLATLAGALAVADSGLVVDLSGVQFMGAATIGVVLRVRSRAQRCGLTFTVRSPSPRALRVLGICGLLELIDPVAVGPVPGSALASWVTVTPSDRVPAVTPIVNGVSPSALGSGAMNNPVGHRAVEASTDRMQTPSPLRCGG